MSTMTPVEKFAELYGFYLMETGGGCTALQRSLESGVEILITAADDAAAPQLTNEPVLIGLHAGGAIVAEIRAESIASAIAAMQAGEWKPTAEVVELEAASNRYRDALRGIAGTCSDQWTVSEREVIRRLHDRADEALKAGTAERDTLRRALEERDTLRRALAELLDNRDGQIVHRASLERAQAALRRIR